MSDLVPFMSIIVPTGLKLMVKEQFGLIQIIIGGLEQLTVLEQHRLVFMLLMLPYAHMKQNFGIMMLDSSQQVVVEIAPFLILEVSQLIVLFRVLPNGLPLRLT